jgi:hypothetical protein
MISEMIVMLQRYVKILQTVALLSFFLPWVTVSCGQQPVAKLSGFDIAAGTASIHNPITGLTQNYSSTPSFAICLAALLVFLAIVAGLMMARRNAARMAFFCSGFAIALILYRLFDADALSTERRGVLDSIATGKLDVKTAFGVWVALAALSFSLLLARRIANESSIGESPQLPSRLFGIALVAGVLFIPQLARSNEPALLAPQQIPVQSISRSDQPDPEIDETENAESQSPDPISIDSLTESDTQNFAGVSCWATDTNGSTIFASDGTALMRLSGRVVALEEQNGAIGGNVLRSKSGNVTVTFTARSGKTEMFEEGSSSPMNLTVFVGGEQAVRPVMRSCGA